MVDARAGGHPLEQCPLGRVVDLTARPANEEGVNVMLRNGAPDRIQIGLRLCHACSLQKVDRRQRMRPAPRCGSKDILVEKRLPGPAGAVVPATMSSPRGGGRAAVTNS